MIGVSAEEYYRKSRFHQLEHESKMRLVKTHSHTSERLGDEPRENAKKHIGGTGPPRPYYNTAVLHRRSTLCVGVWGLEFSLFCIIGNKTVAAVFHLEA